MFLIGEHILETLNTDRYYVRDVRRSTATTVFSAFFMRGRPIDTRLHDGFKHFCFAFSAVRHQSGVLLGVISQREL